MVPVRVQLTVSEWLNHFGAFLVLLVATVGPVWIVLNGHTDPALLWLMTLTGVSTAAAFLVQWRALRFRVVTTDQDAETNFEAVRSRARILRWEILHEQRGRRLVARVNGEWRAAERVTVLFRGREVRLNSMADPRTHRCHGSWFRNAGHVEHVLAAAAGDSTYRAVQPQGDPGRLTNR